MGVYKAFVETPGFIPPRKESETKEEGLARAFDFAMSVYGRQQLYNTRWTKMESWAYKDGLLILELE